MYLNDIFREKVEVSFVKGELQLLCLRMLVCACLCLSVAVGTFSSEKAAVLRT